MSAELPIETLWTLLLAGVRVTALLFAAPLFGHRTVPPRVRAVLALLLVVAAVPRDAAAIPPDAAPLALLAAVGGEALVGLALGFAARLVFAGFGLVGEFVSVQGGLGAATVLDPTSGSSTVVLTSLLQFVALALFLAVDGHHALLRGVVASFESVPPGAGGVPAERFGQVASLGGVIFELAARLAAPVTAVMLISNVAVGILGRTIPQLNLMALQLPAHIGLTLLVLGLGAGAFVGASSELLTEATDAALRAVFGDL